MRKAAWPPVNSRDSPLGPWFSEWPWQLWHIQKLINCCLLKDTNLYHWNPSCYQKDIGSLSRVRRKSLIRPGSENREERGRGHASSNKAACIINPAAIDQVAAENVVEIRTDSMFFRELANLDLFHLKTKPKAPSTNNITIPTQLLQKNTHTNKTNMVRGFFCPHAVHVKQKKILLSHSGRPHCTSDWLALPIASCLAVHSHHHRDVLWGCWSTPLCCQKVTVDLVRVLVFSSSSKLDQALVYRIHKMDYSTFTQN